MPAGRGGRVWGSRGWRRQRPDVPPREPHPKNPFDRVGRAPRCDEVWERAERTGDGGQPELRPQLAQPGLIVLKDGADGEHDHDEHGKGAGSRPNQTRRRRLHSPNHEHSWNRCHCGPPQAHGPRHRQIRRTQQCDVSGWCDGGWQVRPSGSAETNTGWTPELPSSVPGAAYPVGSWHVPGMPSREHARWSWAPQPVKPRTLRGT